MLVGVVGAGTMGAGIAEVFARAEGFTVQLADVNLDLATKGRNRQLASLDKQVSKGKMTQDEVDRIAANLLLAEVEDLFDCELVIEAVSETMDVKRPMFEKLDGIAAEGAILASNTSSLSITALARGLKHDVAGMHFFNPAPVMKLVEVTSGATTQPKTVKTITEIAHTVGKTTVQVDEEAGFIVNRILVPMINEAVGVLAEGVASAEDIDEAMKLGANHPIGPLALADLIGLDVTLAIMEVLQSEFGDPKYRPHPLLRKYVRAGWLGRKTGRGFFSYA
ncbi:MAG: 3-hydroxyacyl-CoA dehydrogenase NAD-binding domain-containing protein [Propionibacteriaceae bacterium]|nr:3-hydroxyacyl-CoA dehydrogenase NAD-binding domain-containing protein [Propionibacteriaceae bacterium]